MKLKRKFSNDVVSHVDVLIASPRWHVPTDLVEQAAQEGWLTLGGGKLAIKTGEDTSVVYTVVRVPGHYCDECNAKVANSIEGKAHVDAAHGGGTWRRDNFYACELLSGATPRVAPVEETIDAPVKKKSFFDRIRGV